MLPWHGLVSGQFQRTVAKEYPSRLIFVVLSTIGRWPEKCHSRGFLHSPLAHGADVHRRFLPP